MGEPIEIQEQEVNNELNVKNIHVQVRQMPANTDGFMPRYKRILSMKRVFTDFDRAQPEDIDEAMLMLSEYITIPASQSEKMNVLNNASLEEIFAIFDAIIKGASAPPKSGGA